MLKIPEFKTKKELFDFLVENKSSLINAKKSVIKRADSISLNSVIIPELKSVDKAFSNETSKDDSQNEDSLQVKVIINTTKVMDSHMDVHIDGLWDKSLKENKRIMHVQEHKTYEFDKIISSGDDLEAYTKMYNWKDLGIDAEGQTQALEFKSNVRKDRNPYMYNQYKNDWVDNHSVGMQYVKLNLAINDEDYQTEKSMWDQHIDKVVNRDVAEEKGYFWAVTEAKAIEGSAVPNGSNPVTPTISVESKEKVENQKESDTLQEQKNQLILGWLLKDK